MYITFEFDSLLSYSAQEYKFDVLLLSHGVRITEDSQTLQSTSQFQFAIGWKVSSKGKTSLPQISNML